jgi:hypothetical protein
MSYQLMVANAYMTLLDFPHDYIPVKMIFFLHIVRAIYVFHTK